MGLRRELGVRDGRRAARRQLDLGLLLHERLGRVRRRRFRGAFLRALYLHGEYVATHIERSDVNGNHYLCDAVGLVFIGAFFRASRRDARWLEAGRADDVAEIFNQTSEDGVDFEKSTAYHRLVLEAFLTCDVLLDGTASRCRRTGTRGWSGCSSSSRRTSSPTARVPLVGDADDGRIQKLGTQALNDHRYLLSAGAALFGRGDFKRVRRAVLGRIVLAAWPDGADGVRRCDPPALRAGRIEERFRTAASTCSAPIART